MAKQEDAGEAETQEGADRLFNKVQKVGRRFRD